MLLRTIITSPCPPSLTSMVMLLAAGAGLGGRIGFFTDYVVLVLTRGATAAKIVAWRRTCLWTRTACHACHPGGPRWPVGGAPTFTRAEVHPVDPLHLRKGPFAGTLTY